MYLFLEMPDEFFGKTVSCYWSSDIFAEQFCIKYKEYIKFGTFAKKFMDLSSLTASIFLLSLCSQDVLSHYVDM